MAIEYALNSLRKTCSRKELCIKEARERLKTFTLSQKEYDTIIFTLVKEKFIDEERYASAYVHDKWMLNSWGRRKIYLFLKQKNIPDQIIDNALKLINNSEYRLCLERLIRKKISTTVKTSQLKSRILSYALAKGYEKDIIFDVMNSIFKEK